MGDLSTAGTTASTVIFRQNHIFVANVGDSTAVLAESNPRAGELGQHAVLARVLTKDHKPDDPDETKQVERLGKIYGLCMCMFVCKLCVSVYECVQSMYLALLLS